MLMQARLTKLEDDQSGFASIVIAIVIILVLSLITVGFAQLMQREQRSALDRQLSSQAYYAAESGINDAVSAINSGFNIAKSTCPEYNDTTNQVPSTDPVVVGASDKYLTDNSVGADTAANYPCLLINPTPPSLNYENISTTSPKIIEMTGVNPANGDPANIDTINVSWQATSYSATPSFLNTIASCGDSSTNPIFPPANALGGIGDTGILQVDLVPISLTNFTRAGLIGNAYTAFLCPSTPSSSPTSAGYKADINGNNEGSGDVISGGCKVPTPPVSPTTPLYCNAQITGLAGIGQSTYFLTLQSIYSPTQVIITAYDNDATGIPVAIGSSNQLNISGAQILIDSTGKAQDVLRRIQVRVSTHNSYDIPSGTAAAGGNICKQISVAPEGSNSSGNCPE